MGIRRTRIALVSVVIALTSFLSVSVYGAEDAVPSPASVPQPEPLDCTLIESILATPDDYVVIDARSPSEYDSSHVPGALNVPFDAVASYADILPEDKSGAIITYCRSGRRATILKNILSDMGYTNISVVPGEQMQRGKKSQSFQCGE